jgi:hypothetical protein
MMNEWPPPVGWRGQENDDDDDDDGDGEKEEEEEVVVVVVVEKEASPRLPPFPSQEKNKRKEFDK